MASDDRYRDLLQLLDLSPQDHKTCLGIAKTTLQQCRCAVSAQSRAHAAQILLRIVTTPQTDENAKQQLEVVAGLLLCKRFHQSQRTGISSSWTGKIRVSGTDLITVLANNNTASTAQAHQPLESVNAAQRSRPSDTTISSTEATGVLREIGATRSRRRRVPDQPLSMSLRSARVTRDSYRECHACRTEYDSEDRIVLFCRDCQNICHKACGEDWASQCRERTQALTCMYCRKETTLVERSRSAFQVTE